MNPAIILKGVIEIVVSLFTGLLIFFASFKMFTVLTKEIDEIQQLKKNNAAVAILIASFVFGVMYIVKSTISPAVENLDKLLLSQTPVGSSLIATTVIKILVIYVLSAVFAFVVIWFSMIVFMVLTKKIDEMKEVNSNNYSIALMLTVLIASISMVLVKPLQTILQSMVPIKGFSDNISWAAVSVGLIQLAISFFAVIFIFFVSFVVFNILTKKIDEEEELKANNFAVSILLSSFIFSMMLLITSALAPANQNLLIAIQQKVAVSALAIVLGKIVLIFVIAAIVAFIIMWVAMLSFMFLTTTIDEMAEIKNKNIAIAIVLGVLLISMALLISSSGGLKDLLQGLFPIDRMISNIPK